MQRKPSSEFYLGLLAPVVLVTLIVPLVLLKAYVLSCLWQWYIVPVFDAPPLSMAASFGVSMIVSYVLYSPAAPATKDPERNTSVLIAQLLHPLLALLAGWVGTWFL